MMPLSTHLFSHWAIPLKRCFLYSACGTETGVSETNLFNHVFLYRTLLVGQQQGCLQQNLIKYVFLYCTLFVRQQQGRGVGNKHYCSIVFISYSARRTATVKSEANSNVLHVFVVTFLPPFV
jgi:hypothetical protein